MDGEASLNDYWRIFGKRKWLIFCIFVLTLPAIIYYAESHLPLYNAQAVLRFGFGPTGPQILKSNSPYRDADDDIDSEISAVQYDGLTQKVAARLSWPTGKPLYRYTIQRRPRSNVIVIFANGEDAVAVTKLVNAVADLFIETHLVSRSRQAKKTVDNLTARQQEVEATLKDMEIEHEQFIKTHHQLGIVRHLAGQLLTLETYRKDLLKKYTVEHPEIAKLDQQIDSVNQRMARLPEQEMELARIERTLKLNEDIYTNVSSHLEEAKVVLASIFPLFTIISRASIPTRPVSRTKISNYGMGIAVGLIFPMVVVLILEYSKLSLSTIQDMEVNLGMPVLGIIPHFTPKKKWNSFLNQFLSRRASIIQKVRTVLLFQHQTPSPFMEVYHSLRANILAQLAQPKKAILLFSSAGVAEGKTLTAVNFCLAAANAGLKTLLVEADFRKPSICRIFGTPAESGMLKAISDKAPWQECVAGTADFLMGDVDLDRILSFPGIENFRIMAGGSDTTHIVEMFSGPQLPQLIEQFREQFDIVVFDCPPVLLFVDPVLIGAHCDGVVMVHKSSKIASEAVKRAKDQFVAAKCRVLGVVLNDMHATDMEPRYGYYFEHDYYAA